MGRVKRIWYLSPIRAAKVQASLRIRAVSPEPPLLAHTSSESRRTFRQKARSLAPLNRWACAVKICHDGMLEDTNSLDSAQIFLDKIYSYFRINLIKQRICKLKCICRWKSMQENKSVMVVPCKLKILSLRLTALHHSASLVMPNSYPNDRIFNSHLTANKGSYIPTHMVPDIWLFTTPYNRCRHWPLPYRCCIYWNNEIIKD